MPVENCTPLPTNHEVHWKRAWSLVNRLSELLQSYDKIIAKQVKKGFIEMVPHTPHDNKTHYIPCHYVQKNLLQPQYALCMIAAVVNREIYHL